MPTETEDIDVIIMRETELSYLLKNIKTQDQSFFPKSQIHFKRRNIKTGEATACIPVWLLEKNLW